MAAITGALSVGIGAIGLGMSMFGASEQREANEMSAYAQQLQIQANIEALRAQQEGSAKLTETQKKLLDLNTQQTKLANDTNIAVIGQQIAAENIRQQQNSLNNQLNTIRQQANVQLEGLNQQNDAQNARMYDLQQQQVTNQAFQVDNQRLQNAISRERLGVQGEQVNLQEKVAGLNARRTQTQAIRQGLAERAFGVQATTNRGAFSSSQRSGQAANAVNKQNDLILNASQNLQGQQAGFGLQRQDLGLQDQNLQIADQNLKLDRANVWVKAQMNNAAESSRILGVQARGIQYGVNQAQFATTGALNSLQDKMFGINENISNIYLNSYNQNTGLVNQANEYNRELMDVNAATSAAVNAAQEKVLLAGGQISQANLSAANAATLGGMGSGIMSLGNMLGNNIGKIGALSNSMFSGITSYNNHSTSIPGDLNYYG